VRKGQPYIVLILMLRGDVDGLIRKLLTISSLLQNSSELTRD